MTAALLIAHGLGLSAWALLLLAVPDACPTWLLPLALGLQAAVCLAHLLRARPDVGRTGLAWRMACVPLILLPPLAPLVTSVLFSGLCLRAALRWNSTEPARRDLMVLCSRWRILGALGVVLGVVWAWGWEDLSRQPGLDLRLLTDVLRIRRTAVGTGVFEAAVAAGGGAVFLAELWRSSRVLALHHRLKLDPPQTGSPSPQVPTPPGPEEG